MIFPYQASGALLYVCAALSLGSAVTIIAAPCSQATAPLAAEALASVRTELIDDQQAIRQLIGQVRDARDTVPYALDNVLRLTALHGR